MINKLIYFAGGCFWGVQEYFSRLKGVISTKSGYANGKTANPSYEEVKSQTAGHAETVEVIYDADNVNLLTLIDHFLRFVDPYSINKQGEDEGVQYRSGIYYLDDEEKDIIKNYLDSKLKEGYKIEILKLQNFYPAEEYHQDYLKKNPQGYCHIKLNLIQKDERKD